MDIPDKGNLPPHAALIFYVSGSKILPPGGPCERIDAEGLKCHEDGISVTCVDLFPGDGAARLRSASLAMASTMKIRKNGFLAFLRVEDIHAAFEGQQLEVTVSRDMIDENPGHCVIQGIDQSDVGNLMVLAEAVKTFCSVRDIEGLVNN